ncbi:MAG: c-type cytochrome [Pseudohongiellaceae bacterium]|jgi:cytochrome c556
MIKRIALTGAVLLGSLLSLNVMAAAEQTPEEKAAADVANRQAVFKLLSVSNGALGGMARGAPYDAAAAKLGVERVIMLAGMIPQLFNNDTTKVAGLTTRASDTIWANKADFDKLAADLDAGAKAALEILNSKGEAGVRDAFGQIGPKCGACHDRFRLN